MKKVSVRKRNNKKTKTSQKDNEKEQEMKTNKENKLVYNSTINLLIKTPARTTPFRSLPRKFGEFPGPWRTVGKRHFADIREAHRRHPGLVIQLVSALH